MPDTTNPAPAPASTDPLTTDAVSISLGKNKNVVLGGGAATGLGGIVYLVMQLFSMHNEAIAKIAGVESQVAVINSKIDAYAEGRTEIKADLRDLRNDLDYIARNGSRPTSLLPSSREGAHATPTRDWDGDLTRDSLTATAVKRGSGGQAVAR